MKQVMVRYQVKPGQTERNEELVRAVYDELHSTELAGLRYATFKLDDDVTFVHIAVETGEGDRSLADLEAFQEFTKDIGERCDVAPVATGLREVGSFRFFGEDAARAG
jgi:hypothetical protein